MADVDEKEWCDIKSFEGSYQITDCGDIRSLDRWTTTKGGDRRFFKGRIKSSGVRGRYKAVNLNKDGIKTCHYVHVLVAETFIGPRQRGIFVLHNDGDRMNNNVTNLRYGTPADNSADMIEHGNSKRGEDNASAVLTNSAVLRISRLMDEGWRTTALAKEFGVGLPVISDIRYGNKWDWLTRRKDRDRSINSGPTQQIIQDNSLTMSSPSSNVTIHP